MDTSKRQFDSNIKIGIQSGTPEIGTLLAYDEFQNSKYAIQCGIPKFGDYIAVSGGINPTGVYPVQTIDFWTSKQAFHHSYVWDPIVEEWKDRVVDSAIHLIKLDENGGILDNIDLEPVIFKIIKNISTERVDTYERNVNSELWVNRWWYDRYLNFESMVTAASPDYFDILKSYTTHVTSYVSGDRNLASSYIRPASYSGVLGPVYAGTVALSDITTQLPWKNMAGPADPANIAVRDIKEDSKGNLWCLLQIGWHYADVYSNKVANVNYMGYECRIGVQYDDTYSYGSSATPTGYPVYDPGYFPRQYRPPHAGTYAETTDRMYRCGLPRARMFIICFNKKSKWKLWDYLPFIPGTRGFKGKYYVDANTRGPCAYTISLPPLKLDVDKYGNVYAVCGTWFGVDRYNSYPSAHWEGISFSSPEYLYFYWREASEMPSGYTPIPEGLDVGRIGPYLPSTYSYNTIWRYDLDTTAYQGKGASGTYNKASWKSAWTYTIGGDRALLTASGNLQPASPTEYYYLNALGNRTLSKMQMKIDTTLTRPKPVYTGPNSNTTVQMPYNIRSWRSEWYPMSGSNSGRELAMEMDLLFAQCDLFTRNYYGTSGVGNIQPASADMYVFDPQSWWEYEEPWRNANLMKPCQIHLDRTGFFQAGNATGDNPTGFNLAEAPTLYYPHMYAVGTAYYEEEFFGRSGCGTVYSSYARVPLLKGCDGADAGWDVILRPASCPYINPADHKLNPVMTTIDDIIYTHPVASPPLPKTYLVSSYLTDEAALEGKVTGHEGHLVTVSWSTGQIWPNVTWTFTVPTINTIKYIPSMDKVCNCYQISPECLWTLEQAYFENCSISGCLPTMVSRHEKQSLVIAPQYNFKYGMFSFTGITWDSFQQLRTKYPQTKSSIWPWRFHTCKTYPEVASEAELHAFGAKSKYIDSSITEPGDYEPKSGESIIRYTSGFVNSVKVVKDAADGGDAAAQQAYDQFMQNLASVKFYIYDTLMQDINFGSFGSSHKKKGVCGMITPMPLLHATYTYDAGNWNLDLIWDPLWGKRLYLITPQTKKFDNTWTQVKTPTKTYWEKSTTATSPENQMVTKVEWRDLTNDQIQKIRKWTMDEDYLEYCVEKWQQMTFVNEFPGGERKAPQINYF